MAYNLTWMETSTPTLGGIFTNVNALMDGMFLLLLLAVFFFALWKYLEGGADNATTISIVFFVMTVIASLGWALGFISWWIVIIPFMLFLAGLNMKFFS